MLGFITWNVDPILIHIGDGGIRWYGLLWAVGIYLGYLIQVKLPPLALFIEMLPKAHLTSDSRMSGSR